MERVELLNYSVELENLCALRFLNKISDDAATAMIRIQMDLVLYETMMSRGTNFRPSDLSSAFRDKNWLRYLIRLFHKGDEKVPERIRVERPILHFATHNLVPFSEPIFNALGNRVRIIEVVRHPLYMLIQQTLNQINLSESNGTSRQFHLYVKDGDRQKPSWLVDDNRTPIGAKPVEKAIYEMRALTNLAREAKRRELSVHNTSIFTIPFESFVFEPWSYIENVSEALKTKVTRRVRRTLRQQNLPRRSLADGISLAIYKRRGWVPPVSGLSEREELENRRMFAVEHGASASALEVLDHLSEEYETEFWCPKK